MTSEKFDLITSLITDHTEAGELIRQSVEQKNGLLITYMNAHCFNITYTEPGYASLVLQKFRVFIDGIGMYLACRLLMNRTPERISATDFFSQVYGKYISDYKIFILGGNFDSRSDKLLRLKHENLCGYYHGYFDDSELSDVAEKINSSSADIVMIGMGVPRQEFVAAKLSRSLPRKVLMCVGNFFEFYTGSVKRAPVIFRKTGLEWLFRLFTEPQRLWRRYIVGNPMFIIRVLSIWFYMRFRKFRS